MKFPMVISTVDVDKKIITAAKTEANNFLSQALGDGSATKHLEGLEGLKNTLTNFPGFTKVTTLQNILDQLIPGLAPLLMMFLTMWLLKKNVKPLWIILGYFVLGVAAYSVGLLGK
jgi:PTS system mannose-specific IID component